jgi:hypothetical protein
MQPRGQYWASLHLTNSGHQTRSVFDRYNIIDDRDIQEAGETLEKYLGEPLTKKSAVPLVGDSDGDR